MGGGGERKRVCSSDYVSSERMYVPFEYEEVLEE